jgi:hypothetical protein|tara:strand:- start:26067 stop:26783 length:717 start_codon:yes stop_codon:yes gene_type:complete
MSTRYVVCLKHGFKYGPEYVNILAKMVKRNCTLPYEFVCYTENTHGIDKNGITILPLPTAYPMISGWWYKPLLFNPWQKQLNGTILYIDLDVIIFRNIDKLFTYKEGSFCVIKDFNRSTNPDWTRMNSSVVRWQPGQQSQVYTEFIKDPGHTARRFHGDQDWLYANVKKDFEFWPDEWIQSYKWEMRNRPPMVRQPNGIRNFKSPGVPIIKENTSIAVFHGDPNPKVCCDPWCKENWK